MIDSDHPFFFLCVLLQRQLHLDHPTSSLTHTLCHAQGQSSSLQEPSSALARFEDLGMKEPHESTPLLSNPSSSSLSSSPSLPRSNRLVRVFKFIMGGPTDSTKLNKCTLFLNSLLLLFCLDASFRPLALNGEEDLAFVRVGAVGEDWAKIHARIPPRIQVPGFNQAQFEDLHVGAIVIYRTMRPVGDWVVGPKLLTSNLTDWTSVIKIDDLWPGTSYECKPIITFPL